jgi:ABC-2 type transport system permease protein
MRAILEIIRKEFIQFSRDRKMFGISFVAPVIQLLILGYAATLDVKNIPTVVCDMDNSSTSRELIQSFASSGYFTIVDYLREPSKVDEQIDDGHASIAIVVPADFGHKITSGDSAPLQVIADGSESNSAGIGMSYVTLIVGRYSENIVISSLVRKGRASAIPGRVHGEIRVWFNPALKSRNFMVPSVLALLLMVMTMILTSLAIVKEKETGKMEQLVVTPIKPYQLMIGKLAPFLIIGIIDVVLVVVFTNVFFDIPVKGSFWLLMGLCMIFLMTTLGLGLFVSTISHTQQQAMLTAIFFFMLPMIFFSGFVFPIQNMPTIIQYVTYIIPLRYFFVIIRGLFLKGVGIETLWPEALALFSFGIVILSMSVLRFKKRLG